jgi:hypothetical protein
LFPANESKNLGEALIANGLLMPKAAAARDLSFHFLRKSRIFHAIFLGNLP